MPRTLALLFALLALALGAAPSAHADTLLADAPGATTLAAGGGYLAWLDAERRLVVRTPDATTFRPEIRPLTRAQPLGIGSTRTAFPRDVVVLYTRPSGGDDDVYAFNLRTRAETRVAAISSSAYDEAAPTVQYGRYVFVRRGGKRPGIYRSTGSGTERVVSTVPSQVRTNGSRVAYWTGRTVMVRPLSGRGSTIRFTSPAAVRSITLTRYRVGWLASDGRVFQSGRFGGSGDATTTVGEVSNRRLTGARAIADDGSEITRYLDAAGVKSITPPLFG